MRTLAVVPIKSFTAAKQRLARVLAGGSRGSLAQAMFSDVLGALRRAELVDAIAVVTADVTAASIAQGAGETVVLHDDRQAGQSAAAEIGIAHAERERFERVLLVPGDTPLLDPIELDDLLERCERDRIEVAIVADRHGTGTNALVLAPPRAIAPAFGPGSFERHVGAARAADASYRAEVAPSLAHDIDTPDDLAELWRRVGAQRRGAQRTRGTLAQLERAGRRAALEGAPAVGHAVEE